VVAGPWGGAIRAGDARLLPSTRRRSLARAGPSSSCSSVPSIVFGTVQSYRLPGMIRRFTDGDVEAAAELLAERHARHREAEPLLPADVDFRAQIESEWAVDGARGGTSSGRDHLA